MPRGIIKEFTFAFPLPVEILLLRTISAALVCGLIGLERGVHKNPVGLRTNMPVGNPAKRRTPDGAVATQPRPVDLSSPKGLTRIEPNRATNAQTGD